MLLFNKEKLIIVDMVTSPLFLEGVYLWLFMVMEEFSSVKKFSTSLQDGRLWAFWFLGDMTRSCLIFVLLTSR